jgi:hypothetical protein
MDRRLCAAATELGWIEVRTAAIEYRWRICKPPAATEYQTTSVAGMGRTVRQVSIYI